MKRFYALALLLLPLGACVTPRPVPPSVIAPSLVTTPLIRLGPEEYPAFTDDSDVASLKNAALQSAVYYARLPAQTSYRMADDVYTASEMAASMKYLADLLDKPEWLEIVRRDFAVYQSTGTDGNRTVTFSSYYEPTIRARLKKEGEYLWPIYSRPPDLIDVDLGLFDPALQGNRIAGRRQGRALVPYYTRSDIDAKGRFKGEGIEVAWAKDPMDIFFLQIEGSGWLDPENGEPAVRIHYDGDNGRKYRSVGQHLIKIKKMPAQGFNHASFHKYMTDHPDERQALLNHNERYIFFRTEPGTLGKTPAFGNISVALTPGRSVATDSRLFPKGAFGWISTEQSVFGPDNKVTGTKPLSRFVVNQDEGGAILGPGRVDFFMGHGLDAERFATHFWFPGKLYFLVKKK